MNKPTFHYIHKRKASNSYLPVSTRAASDRPAAATSRAWPTTSDLPSCGFMYNITSEHGSAVPPSSREAIL